MRHHPSQDRESRGAAVARWATVLIGLALLVVFLFWADRSFNGYRVQLVILVAINAMVAISLTMTSGFTGVFSLGQIGFYGIGAYVGALLTIPPLWKGPSFLPGLPEWLATLDLTTYPPQLALLIACVVGGGVAALVALAVGAPLMRLSGHYVAVATLGFLIIVQALLINASEITRGSRGLNQIPGYTNLWIAYGWALLTLYVAWRVRNSAYGRSMIASRENLIAARAIGIDVLATRLRAFVLGAFFTGVAGALLAHQLTIVAPGAFYFVTTFNIVIMVVLGGMGSVSGAVVGAALLTMLPEYLREIEDGFELGPISFGAHFGISQIILAIGFILVMIFRPRGLFGDREFSIGWPRSQGAPAQMTDSTEASEN